MNRSLTPWLFIASGLSAIVVAIYTSQIDSAALLNLIVAVAILLSTSIAAPTFQDRVIGFALLGLVHGFCLWGLARVLDHTDTTHEIVFGIGYVMMTIGAVALGQLKCS